MLAMAMRDPLFLNYPEENLPEIPKGLV